LFVCLHIAGDIESLADKAMSKPVQLLQELKEANNGNEIKSSKIKVVKRSVCVTCISDIEQHFMLAVSNLTWKKTPCLHRTQQATNSRRIISGVPTYHCIMTSGNLPDVLKYSSPEASKLSS